MFLWRFLVTIVHYIFPVLTIGDLNAKRDMLKSVIVSQQPLQQITSGKVPER